MLRNFPNYIGRCLGRRLVPWERRSGYLLALLHHYVSGQRLFLTIFHNLGLGRGIAVLFLSVARILKQGFVFPLGKKSFPLCLQ